MSLRERLADWTDFDVAQYELGRALGLMTEAHPFATKAKHVFWTDNPVGALLYTMLEQLVVLGVLEEREGPAGQFRWNAAYRGSWEE